VDPHNALFIKIHSLDPVKANFDVSISSTLAELFGLVARAPVVVRVVEAARTTVNFIEISFKNQYIGRSDNWRIKYALQNRSVYKGAPIQIDGQKLRVDEILMGGRPAKSGLISANTRFTFRSRSARLFFLIQLSEEMWEFADDGELYFEKVLGFIKILLTEWQKLKVTHALSIIFFSRTMLEIDPEWLAKRERAEARQAAERAGRVRSDDSQRSAEDAHDQAQFGTRGPLHSHPQPFSSASSPTPQTASSSDAPPPPPRYQDHYMTVVGQSLHRVC
jgi:hypothetical protein